MICWSVSCRRSLTLQDEVSLYDNARERRQWDKLSEFFAIIKTTEHLENARIKSAIGRDEVRGEAHVHVPCRCRVHVNRFAA